MRELLGIMTTRTRNTDERNGDTSESCRKFMVSLVEQKQFTLLENMSSLPVFSGVCVARSICFCVMFCRSLLCRLSCFFWQLCCLSFFDLQISITPWVSSNSSYSQSYFADNCFSIVTENPY